MGAVPVVRSGVRLEPDARRLIAKPYLPGGRNAHDGRTRIEHILDRILALSPDEVAETLAEVRARFAGRHRDLDAILLASFEVVAAWIDEPAGLTADVRDLVGAYFAHEYAIEAAALTNPSIVPAPDQAGVGHGWLRVVVSLRAIGEGHVSCIEFRTGTIDPDGEVHVDPPLATTSGQRRAPVFNRALFGAKLAEVGAADGVVEQVLGRLGEGFTMAELDAALANVDIGAASPQAAHHAIQTIHWLASSNYELVFPHESAISQRVIFPAGPAESHGMEDARFVRFHDSTARSPSALLDADGATVYYATYTAYDGFSVLPQLIETADFATFRIATLNGAAVRNKGMAIFPRRVGGRYAALGRSDNENTYVMFSDHVRFWHEAERIQVPTRPWELVQIGNCGPPIETPAGWLVVTHGVGPMRTYALGAVLLDLEDPRKVLGHLREPLLLPDEQERDGYVPNVVYSCGSLVHGDWLVVAYGASDTSTCFATVPLDALLAELTDPRSRPPAA